MYFLIRENNVERLLVIILTALGVAGFIFGCRDIVKGSKNPIEFEEEKIKIEL